jgi:hypothetical protein
MFLGVRKLRRRRTTALRSPTPSSLASEGTAQQGKQAQDTSEVFWACDFFSLITVTPSCDTRGVFILCLKIL